MDELEPPADLEAGRLQRQLLETQLLGEVKIPLATFQAKLGESAFHVWQVMCLCRDRQCVTFVSREGIAAHRLAAKLPLPRVCRALRRLKLAGLIQEKHRKVRYLGGGKYEAQTFRLVLGQLKDRRVATIPSTIWDRWQKLPPRGGTRNPWGRAGKPNQTAPQLANGEAQQIQQRVESNRSATSRSGLITEKGIKPLRNSESNRSAYKETDPSKLDPVVEASLQQAPPQGGAAPLREEEASREKRLGVSVLSFLPLPSFAPLRQLQPGLLGVPPYPGSSLIRSPSIPPPPPLSSTDPPEIHASACLWAYRGAFQSRYKRSCHIFERGSGFVRSPAYKSVGKGAAELLARGIAPASWAAWSIDTWREYEMGGAKDTPPFLTWVFAQKRIEDHQGWFEREGNSYLGGQVLMVTPTKRLLETYDRMMTALRRARAQAEPEIQAVVAEFFPGRKFEAMVHEAQAASRIEQERLNAAARSGTTWLWN